MRLNKLTLIIVLTLNSFSLYSQESNDFSFKIKGLAFGDAYYIPQHHLPEANDIGGVVLRRAYLTFDTKYKNWFSRIRFEANQDGAYQVYQYEVDFKDLYIGYKFDNHKITLGLSPTKTFDLIESIWGKRYLVRTPMDLQGVSSRDLGLALDGNIIKDIGLKYRFMISDGVNFGAESGDGLKFQGAISWQTNEYLIFDLFASHEKLDGPEDRNTIQFFGGYTREKYRFGAQYSYVDRQDAPKLKLFSVFAVASIYKDIELIGRIDRIIEPSPKGNNISYIPISPDSPATFMIVGLEFKIAKYFTITPNVIHIIYNENNAGVNPKNDLNYRLTLFFKF